MYKHLIALLLALHATQAFAADPAQPAPRFISLEKARASQSGVRVVRAIDLPSDRAALTSGAMRSDAAPKPLPQVRSPLIVPVQKSASVEPIPAVADAVTIQRGGIVTNKEAAEKDVVATNSGEPLLGLYDDNEEPLMSFRDAMEGKRRPVSLVALGAKQGWPLPAEVKQKFTSGFGLRSDPINGKPAFHGGIDLAADTGTPVLATAAGKVVEVANDPRYGKYITILHGNGGESRYGHLMGAAVREGQMVAGGEMIGAVGATGRTTGPHLDYRYRVNGQNIDPMRILTPPRESLRVAQR